MALTCGVSAASGISEWIGTNGMAKEQTEDRGTSGNSVDKPQLMMQQADNIEGTVMDRDRDEVDDKGEYSAGPSKRACGFDIFEACPSSHQRDSSGAGPSHSVGLDIETDAHRVDPFY
ncbi:hypothetical protein RHSIM_Rhsim04G0032500 [Rhododendron simsii]|uniref:Uncharacterized protein n=1 Tax=Rhododendron simsii TaxID=118357 RepID=A0A834H5A2_RHOSS|nr:hypothetical protein RHSIM_Rhsim04G0032500 [Rhododendron simsii]